MDKQIGICLSVYQKGKNNGKENIGKYSGLKKEGEIIMVYKTKEGETLYPVCSFEENQHKLEDAYNRIMCGIYDVGESSEDIEELYRQQERCEHALNVFGKHVGNDGIVYATYEDSLIIKDYIWAYNARH